MSICPPLLERIALPLLYGAFYRYIVLPFLTHVYFMRFEAFRGAVVPFVSFLIAQWRGGSSFVPPWSSVPATLMLGTLIARVRVLLFQAVESWKEWVSRNPAHLQEVLPLRSVVEAPVEGQPGRGELPTSSASISLPTSLERLEAAAEAVDEDGSDFFYSLKGSTGLHSGSALTRSGLAGHHIETVNASEQRAALRTLHYQLKQHQKKRSASERLQLLIQRELNFLGFHAVTAWFFWGLPFLVWFSLSVFAECFWSWVGQPALGALLGPGMSQWEAIGAQLYLAQFTTSPYMLSYVVVSGVLAAVFYRIVIGALGHVSRFRAVLVRLAFFKSLYLTFCFFVVTLVLLGCTLSLLFYDLQAYPDEAKGRSVWNQLSLIGLDSSAAHGLFYSNEAQTFLPFSCEAERSSIMIDKLSHLRSFLLWFSSGAWKTLLTSESSHVATEAGRLEYAGLEPPTTTAPLQCHFFFDEHSCPDLVHRLSPAQQGYAFLLTLLSRFDLWRIGSSGKAFAIPTFFIWCNLLYSRLWWRLPSVQELRPNHFFQFLLKTSQLQWVVSKLLRVLMVFAVCTWAMESLCFRVASLFVPGRLEVDAETFAFQEHDFLMVGLYFYHYCFLSPKILGSVRERLYDVLDVHESIEEFLVGPFEAKLLFWLTYGLFVLAFIVGCTVRILIFTSPFQIDFLFHIMATILCFNALHLGPAFRRLIARAARHTYCRLALRGWYKYSAVVESGLHGQVGFACRPSSSFSLADYDLVFRGSHVFSEERRQELSRRLKEAHPSVFVTEDEALQLAREAYHRRAAFFFPQMSLFIAGTLLLPSSFPFPVAPLPMRGLVELQLSPTAAGCWCYVWNAVVLFWSLEAERWVVRLFQRFCVARSWHFRGCRTTPSPSEFLNIVLDLLFEPSWSLLKDASRFLLTRFLFWKALSSLVLSSSPLTWVDVMVLLGSVLLALGYWESKTGHCRVAVRRVVRYERSTREKNAHEMSSKEKWSVFFSYFFPMKELTPSRPTQAGYPKREVVVLLLVVWYIIRANGRRLKEWGVRKVREHFTIKVDTSVVFREREDIDDEERDENDTALRSGGEEAAER